MGKSGKRNLDKKEKYAAGKKSATAPFASILKLGIAAALFVFMSVIAYADDVVVQNGRIGIGTASPTAKLDVNGDIRIEQLYLDNNWGTVAFGAERETGTYKYSRTGIPYRILLDNNNNVLNFQYYDSGTSGNDVTGLATAMTIKSGNVGIGTTAPATTLDVKGKANFTGNFSVGETSNILFVDNTSGNVGIGTTNPSLPLHVVGSAAVGTYFGKSIAGGVFNIVDFSWLAVGKRLYVLDGIRTDGDIIVETGKVGIGAISPKTPLHVEGASLISKDAGGNVFLSDTPTAITARIGGGIYFGSKYPTGETPGWANILGMKESSSASNSDGAIAFNLFKTSSYIERMRIASTGNVGIGTTDPKAKLDVAGEIKFGSTSLACSSTTEGALRYNSGSKVMEFCDGSAWKQFSSGTTTTTTTTTIPSTSNCNNGAGGTFSFISGDSNSEIARKACVSKYGTCTTGSCGYFSYWYRSGAYSCSCSKPIDEYEWIYNNAGYTQVGQDYGGQATSVSGDSLFVRKKTSSTCGTNSWTLALKELGELSTCNQ